MKKSEFLKAVEQAIQDDDFTAVTLIVNDENLSFIGNMTWEHFEDIILELAEGIARHVKETESIH